MKLWEIIKGINEDKYIDGDKFVAKNLLVTMILECEGQSLIYNNIMEDTISRNVVTLCSGEISVDYLKMEKPYIIETETKIIETYKYNPNYGDGRICVCGHEYYKHFHPYEDMQTVKMRAINCRHCGCDKFVEIIEKK